MERPEQRPGSWLARLDADGPVTALAPSSLTVVQVGGRDGNDHGHWPSAVVGAVVDLVASGQPVFYVECGGYGGAVMGPALADATNENDLLTVHEDKDIWVTPPGEHLIESTLSFYGDVGYRCFVPTLINIGRDLSAHEAQHGPSVVVLDDAQMLRPYFDVTDEEGMHPLRLGRADADRWRVADLRAFAEARQAATVVVLWAPHDDVLDQVIAGSTMHVVVEWPDRGPVVRVAVARRDTVTADWSRRRSLTIPTTHTR